MNVELSCLKVRLYLAHIKCWISHPLSVLLLPLLAGCLDTFERDLS